MAVAVLIGGVINHFIPAFYVQLFSGLIFIGFGLWTIFGKEEGGEGQGARENGKKSPFWFVFTAFFVAELGDKTQLATFGLSAKYGTPLLVWAGATLAMVAVNSLSVVAGGWLSKHIPEKLVKYFGAALFIGFGLMTLAEIVF